MHTLLTIPTITIPTTILSISAKEGSIQYPQQTIFLYSFMQFFIIFLLFFFLSRLLFSFYFSYTFTHVVTILRNRKRGLCQRAYLHTGFPPHDNQPILDVYQPPEKPSRVNLIYFLITYLICLSSVVLSTNCCIVASIDCSTYCHYNINR